MNLLLACPATSKGTSQVGGQLQLRRRPRAMFIGLDHARARGFGQWTARIKSDEEEEER